MQVFYAIEANKPRKTKSCCENIFRISALNASLNVISKSSLTTLFCRASHIYLAQFWSGAPVRWQEALKKKKV